MAKTIKVMHVELKEQTLYGKKHFYFGSKKAIFDFFGKDSLGITYESFRAYGSRTSGDYENKHCIIREGELMTLGSVKEWKEGKNHV